MADLDKLLQQSHYDVVPLNLRGRLWDDEELTLLLQACERTRNADQSSVSGLAAAYAQKGRFSVAILFQRKALEIPSGVKIDDNMQRELAMYEAHQTCRSKPPNWWDRWR